MRNIFEYIYYNLFVFYSKKEKTDRGPLGVISLIQIVFIITVFGIPINSLVGKETFKQNSYWIKPLWVILMIVIMVFNDFYFKNKFPELKEKYKNETDKQRKRKTRIIFASLFLLIIIFFLTILIRDGGFVKMNQAKISLRQ